MASKLTNFMSVQSNGPERLAKCTHAKQGKHLLWLSLSLSLGINPGPTSSGAGAWQTSVHASVWSQSKPSHNAQSMMFGQETLFHCFPIPGVTTMVSSYVLKISQLSIYLVAIKCLAYLLMVRGMYPLRYIVMKVVMGLGVQGRWKYEGLEDSCGLCTTES